MAFIPTGLPGLDHAHAGIEFCLRDLRRSMQERDIVSARGWACLVVHKLSEHFSEEEKLMRNHGWNQAALHAESHGHLLASFARFESRLKACRAVTLELSHLALVHLPEVLRVHHITSDFSFAKFVLSVGRPSVPSAPRVVPRTAVPATRAVAIHR